MWITMNKLLGHLRRGALAGLCAALLLGSVGCGTESEESASSRKDPVSSQIVDEAYDSRIKAAQDAFLVAGSGDMELYIQGDTAEILLKNKRTGAVWTSNPTGRFDDALAQGVNLEQLSSQILMTYEVSGKATEVNSFAQSVSLQQYSFYPLENGVGVNYLLGEKPKTFIVPKALSESRYQELEGKITDEDALATFHSYYKRVALNDLPTDADKALFLEIFPVLKERPIYYFVTPGTLQFDSPGEQVASDFMMEIVQKVFTDIGYTLEDMHRDEQDNQVNIAKKADYSVSLRLEYRLDGNDLVVKIPEGSVQYDTEVMQVTDFWLLPYFGAAGAGEQGYMLVPGGSGALIELNNGKTNLEPYETELLYGEDLLFEEAPKEQKTDVRAMLPVFGLKRGDTAFLGIVEDGDGSMFIDADVSGRIHSYNHVGPRFRVYRPYHQTTSVINVADIDIFPKEPLSGDMQVRYVALEDANANYSGMASAYRSYLLKQNKIKQAEFGPELPFHLRVIGAVTDKQSILGIPVDRPKALTTYQETVSILSELKQAGVASPILELSDWANGGRENAFFNKIDLMKALGGQKGFSALLDYVQKNQIDFYPAAEFQVVKDDSWLDGFQPKQMGARMLNKRIAYLYEYKLTTFERIKGSSAVVVSPREYASMIAGVASDLRARGVNGLSVGTLGARLTSDYNDREIIDRQRSLRLVQEQIEKLGKECKVSVQAPNAYALAGVSMITDLPLTSEQHYMCDRSIPFYQMVLHGVVPMAAEPMNYTGDFASDRLALIESGSIPSFEFIYRDNYELKDTRYNMYGVNYKLWLQQAAALYQEMNTALKDCQAAKIVGHEQVAKGVNRTAFDNGVVLYVNYNEAPVSVGDIRIEAKGFTRVEEGKTGE